MSRHPSVIQAECQLPSHTEKRIGPFHDPQHHPVRPFLSPDVIPFQTVAHMLPAAELRNPSCIAFLSTAQLILDGKHGQIDALPLLLRCRILQAPDLQQLLHKVLMLILF